MSKAHSDIVTKATIKQPFGYRLQYFSLNFIFHLYDVSMADKETVF